MPIKKSAFKHLRQTKKITIRNKLAKENLKKAIKAARKLLALKDKTKAAEAVTKASKTLDKAAQHKIIKKNKASRLKSRLSRQLNKIK